MTSRKELRSFFFLGPPPLVNNQQSRSDTRTLRVLQGHQVSAASFECPAANKSEGLCGFLVPTQPGITSLSRAERSNEFGTILVSVGKEDHLHTQGCFDLVYYFYLSLYYSMQSLAACDALYTQESDVSYRRRHRPFLLFIFR